MDSFDWVDCQYWNPGRISRITDLRLSRKCGKSLLKGRKLKVLFLLDFPHLPWLILLADAVFKLKLLIPNRKGPIPPAITSYKGVRGVDTLQRYYRFPYSNLTHMLKPLYMTRSSRLFDNVHIKRANIEFEDIPEIPDYHKTFPIHRRWDFKRKFGKFLEYDRKSILYLEKFILCETFPFSTNAVIPL